MKKTIYKLYAIGLICTAGAVIYSCTNDDDLSSELTESNRMFSPFGLSVNNNDSYSKITWKPALHTEGQTIDYTAEVSTDSLFTNQESTIFSKIVDSAGIKINDFEVPVRKKLFVRVKTNAYEERKESLWSESKSFRITGTQIILPLYEPNILSNGVTINWNQNPNAIKTRIQAIRINSGQDEPENIGNPIINDISSQEQSTRSKHINGLNPNTLYSVEILNENNVSIGYQTFRTKPDTEYSTILNEGDNLVTAIANAANGDIIGLNPGTYNSGDLLHTINEKKITIQSTSGNPNNTKIYFKEFVLNNSGAGLTLKNLTLDGETNNAAYFINLTSSNNNALPADYGDVLIENCNVQNVSTSAFRANRGPANGYKMNKFEIKYSFFKNFAASSYGFLHLDKLVFNQINLSNSTFTEVGDLFIRYRENITSPSPNATINVTNCTINSIGLSQAYPLLDNNNVAISFNFTNNILANVPRIGGTLSNVNLVRIATNTTTNVSFNNLYNLTNGNSSNLQQLVIPNTVTNSNNLTHNLDWTNLSTTFYLPQNSPLQTASTTGGAIGDPRWWN